MEGTRPARREDADRCGELCRAALEELRPARGGPLFVRRETGLIAKALLRPGGLDRLLADPRRPVLLGTVDDAVMGMAMGRLDAVGETRLGIIDACYVKPGARGVGVGRRAARGLVAWFAASGCRGVDVNALPGDRDDEEPPGGLGVQGAPHHHAPRLGVTERRRRGRWPRRWSRWGRWRVATVRCCWCGGPPTRRRGGGPFPGGMWSRASPWRTAVERELREETGLAVRCGGASGWAERMGPGYHFVILDFTVTVPDDRGELHAGSDAAAVAWVPLEQVHTWHSSKGWRSSCGPTV